MDRCTDDDYDQSAPATEQCRYSRRAAAIADALALSLTRFMHIHQTAYVYRVNIKKVAPPTTFVDILAMREDFCMKFYTTVKQSNVHFTTKFG